MVQVPINYLAVLACMVASMVLGSVWYGPLFGKQWMAMMGMSPSSMPKQSMAKLYAIQAVGSLVMAFVLAHALVYASAYMQVSGAQAGLMVGFWNWLGFIAPVTLGSVLWEGKSWKLWFLNNGYYLVLLCSMGLILSLWK